jgi:hypothetical protein
VQINPIARDWIILRMVISEAIYNEEGSSHERVIPKRTLRDEQKWKTI